MEKGLINFQRAIGLKMNGEYADERLYISNSIQSSGLIDLRDYLYLKVSP